MKKNLPIAALVGILIIGWGAYSIANKAHQPKYSQIWMEYAMNIVRDKKPTPPASARFYAYVSTVYYEAFKATDTETQASIATAQIIDALYPDYAQHTAAKLAALGMEKEELSPAAQQVVHTYMLRIEEDKTSTNHVERPRGDEYWVGENPLEPLAGTWKRWRVEGNFNVTPPPAYESPAYKEALQIVKSSMRLTNAQAKAINFWGGGPGTEAPSGIWQNRLNAVTADLGLSDEEYAYAQMILAQSLADAFIECWKIKYTYWTKRPSMSDPEIDLIWMANPNFPSYVSGHSVISYTAATVLSSLFPQYSTLWMQNAEEAKNSRLWAGIHFSHDIEEGKMLGIQIGNTIVEKLKSNSSNL